MTRWQTAGALKDSPVRMRLLDGSEVTGVLRAVDTYSIALQPEGSETVDLWFSNGAISVHASDPDLRYLSKVRLAGPEHDIVYWPELRILPGGIVAKGVRECGRKATAVPRGIVTGFSDSARRRLRHKLMSIDWQSVDVSWMTLTFHNDWSDDWRDWKKTLRRFMVNIERRFSETYLGYVWRQEWQRRGAPHYHMILVWRKGHRPPEAWFRTRCAHLWVKAVQHNREQHIDEAHLRYGVRVVNVEERRDGGLGRLLGYICGDVTKTEQSFFIGEDGEPVSTGRCWGIRGRVPLVLGTVIALSGREWVAFCERVAARGREVGSRFLANIHSGWTGFSVIGGVSEVANLLQGLGPPLA